MMRVSHDYVDVRCVRDDSDCLTVCVRTMCLVKVSPAVMAVSHVSEPKCEPMSSVYYPRIIRVSYVYLPYVIRIRKSHVYFTIVTLVKVSPV